MKETSAVYECIRSTLGKNSVFSVSHLCEISGVSRSGYYAWLKTEPARNMREQQDRKDFELIAAAFGQRGYSKGAKGIYMCLLHFKPAVVMNLKKIRRLMKKYGLVCRIRSPNAYRQMIKKIQEGKYAPNLLKREFRKYGPRKVLLTDITYLPYSNGIFAYLCTILDAFTKQILSYALSQNLKEDFVLETVEKLVRTHGISLTEETLIHSDQGIHFTSVKFIDIVEKAHLRKSMSRKGNCWDNAPQESFFGHIKDHIGERIKESTEYEEVQKLVNDYIDYYNKERYQWNLAKLSPDEYYKFCTTRIYPLKWINTDTAEQIAETLAVCG